MIPFNVNLGYDDGDIVKTKGLYHETVSTNFQAERTTAPTPIVPGSTGMKTSLCDQSENYLSSNSLISIGYSPYN